VIAPAAIGAAIDIEGAIDAYAEAVDAAKAATAMRRILRDELMEQVSELHDEQLSAGFGDRTMRLHGRSRSVQVVYWERYRDIGAECAPALRAELGDDSYVDMLEEHESITMRPGMTMERIREIIGDEAADKLEPMCDVRRTLTPRRGAWDRIARLHTAGRSEEAETLHAVVEASCWEPQIRCK
jgi:hypothetical protein